MISELLYLAPIGVVMAAALVVVFVDLIVSHKDRYILPWLALSGCVLGLLSVLQTQTALWDQMVWFFSYHPPRMQPNPALPNYPLMLDGAFCIDGFGVFIWIIACIAGMLAIMSAPPQTEDSALSSGEYHGLILLAVSGMMLLAVSHDFLTLLISLEIMSISTYILAGSHREDIKSNEAALKYLVLGAFSTAFLLMGVAFYYGAFGKITLNPSATYEALPSAVRESREWLSLLAMGLIFIGVMFKIGAAPFHFWIPDVYQGAPTPVTALMAVGVKSAGFAVLARLTFEAFGFLNVRTNWIPVALGASVLTMIIGNILAMRQSNIKRLLAYSGIAHTGYLMLAFLVLPSRNDAEIMGEHLKAVIFYLVTYGFMTLGAFGVASLVREDGRPLEEIDDYAGLAKEHPGIALCMAMFMLSMAGMPPLGGFFAKFMIFRAAIEQGTAHSQSGIIAGAVIGILTSVASLYYYLRVIVMMYMSPSNESIPPEDAVPARCKYVWSSSMLIYGAGAITLALGLYPGGVLDWLMR